MTVGKYILLELLYIYNLPTSTTLFLQNKKGKYFM